MLNVPNCKTERCRISCIMLTANMFRTNTKFLHAYIHDQIYTCSFNTCLSFFINPNEIHSLATSFFKKCSKFSKRFSKLSFLVGCSALENEDEHEIIHFKINVTADC